MSSIKTMLNPVIDYLPSFLVFLVSLTAVTLVKNLLLPATGKKKGKNLPPSPPGFPIIGHLPYVLRKPLHHKFTRLAEKYGPAILLRLGNRPVFLISTAALADEALVGHDTIFADRPRITVAKIFGFDYTSIGFAPYGPHWRNLRRMVAMEILSTPKLNQLWYVRTEEARVLARELISYAGSRADADGFTKISLRHKFETLTFNIMMRMVMGQKVGKGDPQAEHFIENFATTTELAGTIFPGDFLSIAKFLDFGRFERKLMKVREDGNSFLRRLTEARKLTIPLPKKGEKLNEDQQKEIKCLLDSLITQQAADPDALTDDDIFSALSFMLTAGADTSAITSEWALSLLINHPEVFRKIREEIDAHTGPDRLVTEQDLPHLPYVQATVLEILRLYPALPLLIPHQTSEDTVISGFDIPRDTMVFVNVPAIHHDPAVFPEPNKFMPERFLDNPELISKTGGGCKFMPFGAGRRRCPGEGLGMRNVGITMATLVQCFDWKSLDGKEIDMEDDSGLSMLKKVPLEVKFKVRDSVINKLG